MKQGSFLLGGSVMLMATISHSLIALTCEEWFKQSGVKHGPKCIEKCAILPTGMDTFACPLECKALCGNQPLQYKILGRLAYYPGLTAEERKLIPKYPKEAIIVFLQKQKAEAMTYKRFRRDEQGDESDAFRHFVWAALLSKEIGQDLAKQFLDAHEAGSRSDDPDKAMDLANNRAGLLAAERLRKEGKLTDEEIEKAAVEELNKGTLIFKPQEGKK